MKSRKDNKEPKTKVVEKEQVVVSNVPKSIYERNGQIYLVINAKPNSKVSQLQDIS